MIYSKFIRKILFKFDAEKVHNFTIKTLCMASRFALLRGFIGSFMKYEDPVLHTREAGLHFSNPIGLAAGMDKNALAVAAWPLFNFGFAEIGSVTLNAQKGNPKPRLFRLLEDKGIIVHLGLPGIGAGAFRRNFEKFRRFAPKNFPFGISIAKNSEIERDKAIKNYLEAFEKLADIADYVTLNLSCPNVVDDFNLQDSSFVLELLGEVSKKNQKFAKPIFIKIGCENSFENLEKIADGAIKNKITGIIAVNSSKGGRPLLKSKNQIHKGGLSGMPLQRKAEETLKIIYRFSRGKLVIIGLGGIFSGADAYKRIRMGANLVQLASGFIYGGPLAIKKINRELAAFLKKDGFKNVKEAVGVDA